MPHAFVWIISHHDTQFSPNLQLEWGCHGRCFGCTVVLIIQQSTDITKIGWHSYVPVDMALCRQMTLIKLWTVYIYPKLWTQTCNLAFFGDVFRWGCLDETSVTSTDNSPSKLPITTITQTVRLHDQSIIFNRSVDDVTNLCDCYSSNKNWKFSIECQSIPGLLWFSFTLLCDWFRKHTLLT